MDFEDYKKIVGYDRWESLDRRFGGPAAMDDFSAAVTPTLARA
jgi:hypothetical protein